MSFKREGDDQSQLNLLKKRRVSDLLADDVPEDEAFLMSNGRYACTVCHHRPVLDTIAMLLVHRQGKKHQSYVKSYYAKKQHLMKEVEKRKQHLYLMNQEQNNSSLEEDVAPLLTKTRKATHHALLKAAPYKGYGGPSRKQESSSHSFQGKTTGSFFQRVSQNSFREDSSCLGPATSATHVGNLPGNRIHSSISQSEMTADCPSSNDTKGRDKTSNAIGHTDDVSDGDSLSKLSDQNGPPEPLTVTEKRCLTLFQLKPYIPKCQRNKGLVHEAHVDSESVTISTTQSDNQLNTKMSLTSEHESRTAKPPPALQSCTSGKETASGARASGNIKCDPGTKQTHPIPSKDLKSSQKISKSATRSKNSSGVSEDTSRMDREKYLKLTSSGWKTDWKGGWVQDQDVEFDSDEDVPK
ncbi:sodium channel modifier 1-like isoform X2 [Patiria miniata]|uniref:Sodium channel modifier 1 n=1 Tax=Patiria miniata TaxID=46514 RepID=A0A913ZNC2_PATMI|nr:sodium channel modifier 1-like isoform X2 [Patiria miniata]